MDYLQNSEKDSEFVCCGQRLGDLWEWIQHVESHGSEVKQEKKMEDSLSVDTSLLETTSEGYQDYPQQVHPVPPEWTMQPISLMSQQITTRRYTCTICAKVYKNLGILMI